MAHHFSRQGWTIAGVCGAVALLAVYFTLLWPHATHAAAPVAAGGKPEGLQLKPLPASVDITVPGGLAHIVPPPGLCEYPKEVADRVSAFMTGMHVLLAAGSCSDIRHLLENGSSIVGRSVIVAVLDNEFTPATRSTKTAYFKSCFEQFPEQKDRKMLEDDIATLNSSQNHVHSEGLYSLGLLKATRDAVIGGMLGGAAAGPNRIFQIQILACMAPANVPLIWLFQDTLDRDSSPTAVLAKTREVLDVAVAQSKATAKAN